MKRAFTNFLIRSSFIAHLTSSCLARLGRLAGSRGWRTAPDPVEAARQAGRAGRRGLRSARRVAAVIATHVHTGHRPRDAVEAMLYLVFRYREDPDLARHAAKTISLMNERAASHPIWVRLGQAFPDNPGIFRELFYSVLALRGEVAASTFLDLQLPPGANLSPRAQVERAFGLDTLRRGDEALVLLAEASKAAPDDAKVQLGLVEFHERRGQHLAALDILRACPVAAAAVEGERARARLAPAERYAEPGEERATAYIPRRVLEGMVLRAPAPAPQCQIGPERPLVLINANLGPGGAERQFVCTAIGLRDRLPTGAIKIWCRSLGERDSADFFLPSLQRAGLSPKAFAEFGDGLLGEVDRPDIDLLPPQVRTYAARLTAAFARTHPSVVHIWQESSIAAAGLAALRAGVPRIVLSLRTQPLPEKNRDLPIYRPLLQILGSQQNVVFTVNSDRARERYARWLDLPEARFETVYNGVRMDEVVPEEGREAFASALGDAPVIGTVMRFDENKRPLEWVDTAARLHAARPDLRFVMIGSGPLLDAARLRAKILGLDRAILFPGTRADIAWWLSRMNLFLLTSRVEGLPNAVVEAQLAGLPVIVTRAGGATEAIEPGVTGLDLPVEPYDPVAAAQAILTLLDDPARLSAMGKAARIFAGKRFAVDRMLDLTLSVYRGDSASL